MPHCIAVFVSDCLRHGVMNITVSRLSSLVIGLVVGITLSLAEKVSGSELPSSLFEK